MDKEIIKEHYYGDITRVLFIVAGAIMAVMLPFFSPMIHMPIFLSILGIVVLVILAGFLNPTQLFVMILSMVVAIGGFIIFEWMAVSINMEDTYNIDLIQQFFWANQILAFIFFVASYLCVKSVRGKMLAK